MRLEISAQTISEQCRTVGPQVHVWAQLSHACRGFNGRRRMSGEISSLVIYISVLGSPLHLFKSKNGSTRSLGFFIRMECPALTGVDTMDSTIINVG
mmetsp:Transcript_33882/g.71100  ORF Transcript_33882/g.71100 Transcript_33882/m.71100 type:complete len:97 (+) Transcript_33882:328-618(+)